MVPIPFDSFFMECFESLLCLDSLRRSMRIWGHIPPSRSGTDAQSSREEIWPWIEEHRPGCFCSWSLSDLFWTTTHLKIWSAFPVKTRGPFWTLGICTTDFPFQAPAPCSPEKHPVPLPHPTKHREHSGEKGFRVHQGGPPAFVGYTESKSSSGHPRTLRGPLKTVGRTTSPGPRPSPGAESRTAFPTAVRVRT